VVLRPYSKSLGGVLTVDQGNSGADEGQGVGRLVLPSLLVSRFAIGVPPLLVSLLLIEIGETFGQSVGAAGQISTASYVVAFVGALIMGFLSMKFNHKHLLLIGSAMLALAAIGCAFSPAFSLMVAFFAVIGLGSAIATPMIFSILGELYPVSKRASVTGIVMSGLSLAFIIGAPAITYIAGFGSWRTAFLTFVFPVVALSTVLSYLGLPSVHPGEKASAEGRGVGEGFKEILVNRSAVVCLLGTALNEACWQAVLLYTISFFRQRFLVSTGFASMIIIGGALIYTIGSVVSGRVIDRFGRKRTTVSMSVLAGAFTIIYLNVPDLWTTIVLTYVACLFTGFRSSANTSLTLEQVPAYRGTMMSANTASWYMGMALGAWLGGVMLLWYDYNMLGIALGGAGVAAALLFQFLSKDPTVT
jgi:predicted MFS family arabinose efflux permease